MLSTPLLPLLPGPHWPRMVALDRVASTGQTELNCVLMLNWILEIELLWYLDCVLMLNWIVWNKTVLTFNCV